MVNTFGRFFSLGTSLSVSLSLFPVAHTLEHRFMSFQFLKTVGRTPWTGNEPVARPLLTPTQNKRRYISMP
jgi:hypothetical protein